MSVGSWHFCDGLIRVFSTTSSKFWRVVLSPEIFLGATSKKPAELEVCYINDAAFDDDTVKEEDEDNDDENGAQQFGPEEGNLGQDPEPSEPAQFPRSKSDWEAFRNPSLLSAAQEPIRNRFDSILTFQYL